MNAPHRNPLWTANRAFVMFEALDLAARAAQGQTAWSHRNADEAALARPQSPRAPLRRAALLAVALLAAGGLAAARWIA